MLHAIVLMVAVFLNPTPDNPAPQPKIVSIVVPDAKTCLDAGADEINVLMQNPAVHSVKIACFDVDGHIATDKAT